MKALTHRYAAAGTVFAVAALVIGVPLLRGIECLLSFLLASLIVTAFQRRKHARAATRPRPRQRSASPARTKLNNEKRPRAKRPELYSNAGSTSPYDDESSGYGWPIRDALDR